jgi:hypothetical protein
MNDIVHFMFHLEVDTGPVEILQNDPTYCRGGSGRKTENFIRNLFRRDSCLRCQAMVARKHKNERVRPHARAGQVLHVLFPPYERRIKLASYQGFGEHKGVVTRQTEVDARKFFAKNAIHLGQQADFDP